MIGGKKSLSEISPVQIIMRQFFSFIYRSKADAEATGTAAIIFPASFLHSDFIAATRVKPEANPSSTMMTVMSAKIFLSAAGFVHLFI